MYFDTHCHVNFAAFKETQQAVIQRSLEKGISLVVVGTQIDTSRSAVELAEKYEGVYAAVGLHPVHLYSQYVDEEESRFKTREETFDFEVYRELGKRESVVAIGEMGLDYFRLDGVGANGRSPVQEIKKRQRETFESGLGLAKDLGKPMIIHTRPSPDSFDAYDDVLGIVRAHSEVQGVVHCFGGSFEQAQQFVELGWKIGVTGIVTFKKALETQRVATELPLESLVIETDAPYLAPEPYRGKQNEPSYVVHVAEKIAELRGVSVDEIAEQTTSNAKELFGV